MEAGKVGFYAANFDRACDDIKDGWMILKTTFPCVYGDGEVIVENLSYTKMSQILKCLTSE